MSSDETHDEETRGREPELPQGREPEGPEPQEPSGLPPVPEPAVPPDAPHETPSARRRTPPPPPPRGHRRRSLLPPIAGILGLAAIGFLIWYFVFRSDGGEEQPAEARAVEVIPTALDFGDEDLGKRSGTQAATLTYAGATPLGIAAIEITGKNRKSFAVARRATTCSTEAPLNEGEGCAVAVRFRPRARGMLEATVTIRFNGGRPPVSIALRGTGVGAPVVSLEAASLEFGGRLVGGEPSSESTTLSNTGNAPLAIESISLDGPAAGDYTIVQRDKGCSPKKRVPPGGSCTLTVRFSPSEVGERAAVLAISHDAEGSPTTISLAGAGEGQPKASLTPKAIDFGRVRLRQRSEPETVTVENAGTKALLLSAIGLEGPNRRDFRITQAGTCEPELSLAPGETCTVTVRFRPTKAGNRTATLSVSANTRSGTHTAELRGRGARGG